MSIRLTYEPSVQALVADVLGPDSELFAEPSALRNRVSWPVVVRTTGLGRLGGGEVVIVPRGRESDVLRGVGALRAAGVVAVVVDPSARAEAETAGGTLPIALSPLVREGARLKSEMERYIVRRRRELFVEDQRLHRLLVDSALGGASLQRLVELAAREHEAPVILDAGSEAWRTGIEPSGISEVLLRRGELETRSGAIALLEYGAGTALVAPVEAAGRRRGTAWLLRVRHHDIDGREVLLSAFAAAAAIALSHIPELQLPSLDAVLAATQSSAPDTRWVCLAFRSRDGDQARIARGLLSETRARGLDAMPATENGMLYYLMPAGSIDPGVWIRDAFTKSGMRDLAAGLSRSGAGSESPEVAAREASAALELGQEGITRYEDVELEALLRAIPDWEGFVEHTLGGVLDRPELLATLGAFLGAGGNAARASERLSIHRNTMTYRLRQCRKLLPVSPEDPAARFVLDLALRIRALHDPNVNERENTRR